MVNGNSNLNGFGVHRSPSSAVAKSDYFGARSSVPEGVNPEPVDYWGLLKSGIWWLVSLALLGCAGGFLAVILQDPVYHAAAMLELQGVNETFMGMNAVDPLSDSSNYSTSQLNINTQLRIIESGSVRLTVVDRMAREIVPTSPPIRGTIDVLRLKLRRTKSDPIQAMKAGIGMANWSLKAKSVPGTRIITIAADSTIPEIASAMVNNIANEYISLNSQNRLTNSQRTSQWLEALVEQTRSRLDEAEQRLRDFQRQSGIVGGNQDVPVTLPSLQLSQLTGDYLEATRARISKEGAYNAVNQMVKSGTVDAIPDVAADPILKQVVPQLQDAKRKLDEDLVRWTPQHKTVKADQDEVNRLTAVIEAARQAVVAKIKSEYEDAAAKEATLKKVYDREQAAVSGQQDKTSQYALLKREVDLYRQTLNNMLQQVNTSSLVAGIPTQNVHIIDSAYPPGVPYKPDPVNFVVIGGTLGLILGSLVMFGKDRASRRKSGQTFAAPGSAPSVLAVPELGVIPSANANRGFRRKSSRPDVSLEIDATETGLLARTSVLTEPFRLLITSLLLMRRNGQTLKTMVVSSPGPAEGKTTVASNLGVAMAETGQRVLLIDMDLRRPRLHRLFGLPNDVGFCDLVKESTPLQIDASSPVILRTKVPGLSLLPGGHMPIESIGELFHSPRVPALLRQAAEAFDTVIIDTAPILQFSESRFVASFADGVILVLRASYTDKESAIVVREQLATDGIKLLGTILNDWNPKNGGMSKYPSYYQTMSDTRNPAQ